jgi:hypothetical protein
MSGGELFTSFNRAGGVPGKNTMQELLVILVFKLCCEFYAFSKDEQKFDNKQLMDNVNKRIVVFLIIIIQQTE